MTYVLAWTTIDCAFVVADAAVTREPSATVHESSFGEPPYSSIEKAVDERALKLYRTEAAILSGAGNSNKLRDFANQFAFRSKYSTDIASIIRDCADNYYGRGCEIDFSAVIGFVSNGSPVLYTFNRNGNGKVARESAAVELGSGRKILGMLGPKSTINASRHSQDPKSQISMVLGVLQSHGVRNHLLERGVGGIFSGVYVGIDGTHWQPDTMYALVSKEVTDGSQNKSTNVDHSVISMFRRDVLISASTLAGGKVLFMNGLEDDTDEDLIERGFNAAADTRNEISNLKFHAVCLVSIFSELIVVVEMKGNSTVRNLGLRFIEIGDVGLSRISIGFSEELIDLLAGKAPFEQQPNVVFLECEPWSPTDWVSQEA